MGLGPAKIQPDRTAPHWGLTQEPRSPLIDHALVWRRLYTEPDVGQMLLKRKIGELHIQQHGILRAEVHHDLEQITEEASVGPVYLWQRIARLGGGAPPVAGTKLGAFALAVD
jgi:hypothetical protein